MTRTHLHFVVPAIQYPQSGSENWSLGNLGEALAASLVRVRLELKVPGNVESTNGERLRGPSPFGYEFRLAHES